MSPYPDDTVYIRPVSTICAVTCTYNPSIMTLSSKMDASTSRRRYDLCEDGVHIPLLFLIGGNVGQDDTVAVRLISLPLPYINK